MPDSTAENIRSRLAALQPSVLEVVDDSAAHHGHPGAASGGGHFQLRVISARFAGQSKIARHRLVYDLLIDLMQRDIHALAMTLLAPDEAAASPQLSAGN